MGGSARGNIFSRRLTVHPTQYELEIEQGTSEPVEYLSDGACALEDATDKQTTKPVVANSQPAAAKAAAPEAAAATTAAATTAAAAAATTAAAAAALLGAVPPLPAGSIPSHVVAGTCP